MLLNPDKPPDAKFCFWPLVGFDLLDALFLEFPTLLLLVTWFSTNVSEQRFFLLFTTSLKHGIEEVAAITHFLLLRLLAWI